MIPTYPNFKKLELSDKKEIELHTEKFPPYSDFEFVSLWSWDVKEEVEVCWLNDNLVVKFTDYVMGSPFYSFLGTSRVNETCEQLLSLSSLRGYGSALGLVPHVSIEGLSGDVFAIYESREHFDYMYDIESHVTLAGGKLKARRNFLNGFLKLYPHYEAVHLDLSQAGDRAQVLDLCHRWEQHKGYSIPNENAAHHRFLSGASQFKYTAVGIRLDDKLIAYCSTIMLPNGNANALFEKVDIDYHGVHALLRSEVAKDLNSRSHRYLNYEQDLGIESLRKSKMAYVPDHFLKKYSVSLRSSESE